MIDSGLTSTALTCICPVGAYRSLTWISLHPILQLDKGIDDVFPIRLFTGPPGPKTLDVYPGRKSQCDVHNEADGSYTKPFNVPQSSLVSSQVQEDVHFRAIWESSWSGGLASSVYPRTRKIPCA